MPVSLCSQHLFQRTDNRSVRMYQGNLHLVLIVFPDLQVHSRFISSDPQFCLIIFSLSYAARRMPCPISFITGSHTECHTTIPNRLIQIRFQQRCSVMCSITVSEAQIDHHRHLKLLCGTDRIVHPLHQFCGSGKSIRFPDPQLHHQQTALRRYATLRSLTFSSISRCDPQYSRPMTTRISAWNQCLSFCHRIRFQCPIDLLLCVLTADPIPFGGIARYRLIPQPQDPCGSILVPKVRMRIIQARIDTGNQNPFTKQIRRLILDRIHTGSLPAFICSKIQSLRCFDILYRRILCKPFDLILRNICNSIISKKGCNNNLIRLKLRCRPEVTNDQLPPLCVFFIPCVQIHRCFPFPGCGIESKI